jgi:hypothetical protein
MDDWKSAKDVTVASVDSGPTSPGCARCMTYLDGGRVQPYVEQIGQSNIMVITSTRMESERARCSDVQNTWVQDGNTDA